MFLDELYKAYVVFAEKNHYPFFENQSMFTMELKKLLNTDIVEIKKIRIGSKTKSGIIGLKLVDFPLS